MITNLNDFRQHKLNENKGVYHNSYSSAVQFAREQAEKQGYQINEDDWFRVVNVGPKKPDHGKTNKLSVELMKDGKPSKKMLHMQVYGMGNKYELNYYIQ